MTRRQVLAAGATALPWLAKPAQGAGGRRMPNMGIAPTACSLRMRSGSGFNLIEHCHEHNVGAVETRLPSNDPAAVKQFRQKLEAYDMRAILNAPLPRDANGVEAFDVAVKSCKEAGAYALHAAMTGRRYEDLNSPAEFKQLFERCQKQVELAEPVLRKHRMPLAIENHKGWRSAEQAAWMKRVGSEWVGVCYDFGNNVSLCEDPKESLRNLAPFTMLTHIKDMGVEMYEDGFLLSEVLFGDGIVDLKETVKTLQAKDPKMVFLLEMITRDPLKVPVFTDKYWATFDDSYSPLPGRDLARTLQIVHRNPPKTPLPRITGMTPEARVKYEDENNAKCLDWARRNLDV